MRRAVKAASVGTVVLSMQRAWLRARTWRRKTISIMAVVSSGLVATSAASAATASSAALTWRELPTLPDREGFAGSYAGVSGGALIVAGGANFPDKRPWEGGTKIWYDKVFVLEPGANAWREGMQLPAVGGYGVALTVEDALVMIGGGDAKRNFSEVWGAGWNGQRVHFAEWPRLPKPLAMSAGAIVGRTIYVAGGLEKPDATRAENVLFAFDLDQRNKGWRELPPCPGGERFLAVAGSDGEAFYLFGGAKLITDAQGKATREWLRDAWKFSAKEGWKRLADLPRVAVAAPTPAPNVGGKLLIVGGDDGTQVSVAPTAHQGFPRDVLAYDPKSNSWTRAGEVPFSIVTTSATTWRGEIVIASGEAKPGVRTPAVWTAALPQPAAKAKQ